MYMDYELKKVTDKLEHEIKEHEAQLAAWKRVTFPTKKDGTPFKAMHKNISGALYIPYRAYNENGLYILNVYDHSYGFIAEDEIDCWEYTEFVTDAEKIAKPQNINEYEGKYVYDLEDIKKAVAERIEALESTIAELKDELQIAESAFNDFFDAVTSASRDLAKVTGNRTSLYYEVMESLKNNIYSLAD